MQYQFVERYEYVKSIEFINSNPLHVDRIKYFKEEGISGIFEKKEFKYSFDKNTWSNWITLTQSNLTSIPFRNNNNFYLHTKYSRTGINSGNILKWYLFYDGRETTPSYIPPSVIIDADLLQGQGPEYYLDRRNHFGPYFGLNVTNIIDGSSAGVYSHRIDSSLGTELFFKRIAAGNGINIFDSPDGKIIISIVDSSVNQGVYDSAFDPSVKMPTAVGGIPANTTVENLEGKTFSQLFDELLFPTAYPSLSNPVNSFGISPNSLQEIGIIINITATAGFNRGSINPQYAASSPYRSGLPTTYDYIGIGLTDVSSSALSNVQTINNYIVLQGNQANWSSRVYYAAGVQPYDSKGNIYNTPLSAGITGYINVTFEGVYPLFATTTNTSTLTKQGLISMISGNNIVITLSPEFDIINRQKFELPNVWISARPLVAIQQFNTQTLTWDYPGGSAATSLLLWSTSASTETIQGNLIAYTKYTYIGVQRSSVQIRLIF
jgi:hypothetical protein